MIQITIDPRSPDGKKLLAAVNGVYNRDVNLVREANAGSPAPPEKTTLGGYAQETPKAQETKVATPAPPEKTTPSVDGPKKKKKRVRRTKEETAAGAPERNRGESPEDYRKRLDDFMAEYHAAQSGDTATEVLSETTGPPEADTATEVPGEATGTEATPTERTGDLLAGDDLSDLYTGLKNIPLSDRDLVAVQELGPDDAVGSEGPLYAVLLDRSRTASKVPGKKAEVQGKVKDFLAEVNVAKLSQMKTRYALAYLGAIDQPLNTVDLDETFG